MGRFWEICNLEICFPSYPPCGRPLFCKVLRLEVVYNKFAVTGLTLVWGTVDGRIQKFSGPELPNESVPVIKT